MQGGWGLKIWSQWMWEIMIKGLEISLLFISSAVKTCKWQINIIFQQTTTQNKKDFFMSISKMLNKIVCGFSSRNRRWTWWYSKRCIQWFMECVCMQTQRKCSSPCVCVCVCVNIGCTGGYICNASSQKAMWVLGSPQEARKQRVEGRWSRPLLCVVCSVLIFSLQSPLCGTEPYANATVLGGEANAPRSFLMYIMNKCVLRDTDSYRLNWRHASSARLFSGSLFLLSLTLCKRLHFIKMSVFCCNQKKT